MISYRLFQKPPAWIINGQQDGLTPKDVARLIAINIFGGITVAICIIYSVIFHLNQNNFLFWISFSVGILFAIPIFLNYLNLFFVSRVLYTLQAPILVLTLATILGPNFGLQYFFVLLFGFPFIYFKAREKKWILWFFIYNLLCIVYYEFGGSQGFIETNFSPSVYLAMKITILALFLLMTFLLLFVFQKLIMLDEQKMVRTQFEKEKAVQVKQEFLSVMSHELRTPLNDIVTISNILDEKPDHKDRYAFLSLLKQNSINLLSITNDILDFNNLEANKTRLEIKSKNLQKTITDVVETYYSMADEKGLKLSLHLDSSLARFYKIDDVKISQILGNLINNAIRFTNDGEVVIAVKKEKTEGYSDIISFEVSDTGKGISPDKLESIFESFTQIKSVITHKTGGSGLGLAIVKRLLKLHNSDIVVESAPGRGSKFSFKIQLKTSRKLQDPKNKKLAVLTNRNILLVEDNTVNALVAEKLLENWGLNVQKEVNGQNAVETAKRNVFDFILMDLHMPVLDGVDATKTIREGSGPNRNTPIYALTADVMGEGNEKINKYFDGFFTKPLQKEKLQAVLIKTISEG